MGISNCGLCPISSISCFDGLSWLLVGKEQRGGQAGDTVLKSKEVSKFFLSLGTCKESLWVHPA